MRSAMMRQTLLTPAAGAAVRWTGTSPARIAPPGPEPRTTCRSTPRSPASRRAFGDAGASPRAHLAQDAGRGRLDLDRDLVGLDLDDWLALGHGVARPLEPAQDLAGLLRQVQRGHDDVRRHQPFFPQRALAASNTLFSLGTVRSSSTGENGTATSIAPIRLTGESSG